MNKDSNERQKRRKGKKRKRELESEASEMFMYIDEEGNLTSTPPDQRDKEKSQSNREANLQESSEETVDYYFDKEISQHRNLIRKQINELNSLINDYDCAEKIIVELTIEGDFDNYILNEKDALIEELELLLNEEKSIKTISINRGSIKHLIEIKVSSYQKLIVLFEANDLKNLNIIDIKVLYNFNDFSPFDIIDDDIRTSIINHINKKGNLNKNSIQKQSSYAKKSKKKLVGTLKNKLRNENLEKVLQFFISKIKPNSEFYDSLIMLKARLNKLNSDSNLGLIQISDYNIVYANLLRSLLSLINDLKKKDIIPTQIRQKKRKQDKLNKSGNLNQLKSGIVKFFNAEKGYGFITEQTTNSSFFVHYDSLIDEVKENDQVVFEIKEGPKGPTAVDVKLNTNSV